MRIVILSLLLGCSAKKRAIKKHNYPPEYREQFVAECLRTGSLEMCECSADNVMAAYPSEEVIGVQYSAELTTHMANIGVHCMPLEEIKSQMITGCQGTGTAPAECECSIGKIIDQFNQKEMADVLVAMYSGDRPPQFMAASEEASVSCMKSENMKESFIDSCNDGTNVEYCQCVYQQMHGHFGEEQLKRLFFKLGVGDADAETTVFDFLRVAKEKCDN